MVVKLIATFVLLLMAWEARAGGGCRDASQGADDCGILECAGKESCRPREGSRSGLIGPAGIGQPAAASEAQVISNQALTF